MNKADSTEPRRYLIAIGSSSCRKMGLPDLKHVEVDVQRVTTLFEAQGYQRVLSDQIELDDTSARITNAISSWFASSERKPSDCVVVYYGGHGDEGGRFGHHYLFTFESNDNRITETAIKTKDFVECFFQGDRNRTPTNILLILDTCYANVGGKQISQVLSELKGVAPNGSGFWIICSADDNTEAGDGAFVDALCAVLHPDRAEFQQDSEFIPISTLVDRINQHFINTKQAQQAIADGRGIRGKEIFIRYPRLIASQDSSPQEIQGTEQLSSQLVECLWSLNYEHQTEIFKQHLRQSCRVAAFVVQAEDERIQSWLVKRLFKQLPNVINAMVFRFRIPAHPMWQNRNFDELWIDLGKKLKCAAERDSVLDELVKTYRSQPVIVVMHGWKNKPQSQVLQTQVLNDFWEPLVTRVRALEVQPIRSRLILFLTEAKTKDPEPCNGLDRPIWLAPLTRIGSDEVREWLESDQVYSVLNQKKSADEIANLINCEILEWNADPVQTLKEICDSFKLENGIAEIEPKWRLVG